MGRSRSAEESGAARGGVKAKAVFGTNTVLLAWDVPLAAERRGLAGFAIEKISSSHRQWLLAGGRHFKGGGGDVEVAELEKKLAGLELQDGQVEESLQALGVAGGAGEMDSQMLTTHEAPIQGFSWCDYTCQPGEEHEYRICPAYFRSGEDSTGRVDVREEMGASLVVRMESNGPSQHHEVHFNRGVAGSQAYRRRFGALPPQEVGPEAWAWLSNGLSEALLAFIGRAAGPGWSLRGAFYEFTWQPALEALLAAAARGVDVSIVVDCGPTAPREATTEGLESLPTSGRVDLNVPFQQKDDAKRLGAKWDAGNKVWFAPSAEPELLQRWGLQKASQSKNGPLKADVAIDKVPGLRKLIVRRERCKAISHNKFMVLIPPKSQAASVWTGSTNLTESGVFGQANVAHIVNDSSVAETYLAYWKCLAADMPTEELTHWNASCMAEDALPSPSQSPAAVSDGKGSVQVVTCPRPTLNLIDSYAAFLASAASCACLTFAFSIDKTLGSILEKDSKAARYLLLEKRSKAHTALLDVAANRVASGAVLGDDELKGAVDKDGAAFWGPERLTGLNEHVRFVHTKFMLDDPLGPAPTTISGSANFSQASVRKNDENMLFVTGDTRVADLYFVEFWRLFQHWRFRDRVSQRMWDRRSAAKDGSKMPPLMNLYLVDSDSWTAPFFDSSNAKCQERQMLMAMHVGTDECEAERSAAAAAAKGGYSTS